MSPRPLQRRSASLRRSIARAGTGAFLCLAGLVCTIALFVPAVHGAGAVTALTAVPLIWLAVLAAAHRDQHATATAAHVHRTRANAASDAQLAALLRASTGNSIVATDVDGLVTVWNAGAEQMLGWRADEVIGTPIPLLHDRAEFLARAAELGVAPGPDVFRRALEHAESDTRNWTYVRKDGSRLTVALTVTAIRDTSDTITGYIGIATDVTELHTTLHTLDTQTQMYATLLDHLPGTIVAIVDEDLRYVSVSGAALPFGITHDEVVGHAVGERTPEGDHTALSRDLYERALTGPTSREAEIDGRHWEIDGVPLVGPQGQRLAMSVARDVTERHGAAEQLRQTNKALSASEERFRTAFAEAPIGIAIVSAHPGNRGQFMQVNASFGTLVGRRPEQVVGMYVEELTYPGDRHVIDFSLDGGLAEQRLQKRYWHSSGRPVWVEVCYALVRDDDGEPLHFVTLVEDITTRRASELALLDALDQQRTAAKALQDLDRVRTEVMANISHELRTPLTALRGNLELFADGDAGELSRDQAEMVSSMTRNSDRLRALVDDLVILARMDRQDAAALPATNTVDVTELTRLAAERIRSTLARREQELHAVLPDGPVLVAGDTDQLDRAVLNLLSNASKFSPDGTDVELTLTVEDDRVRIAVADRGRGIPADEIQHVFERFYRGADSEAEGLGGTGLGLAMVRTIVDRHGGTVDVASEVGRGSLFTILLPAVSASLAA